MKEYRVEEELENLTVLTRETTTTKWLLSDNGPCRFVVDVEVASRVLQVFERTFQEFPGGQQSWK
jgi:hypothetical protein